MSKNFMSIGWRISIQIIIITTILASIIMVPSYFVSYANELKRVTQHQQEVGGSHIPVLSESLWNFEYEKINKHIKGMLAMKYIVYVELKNHNEVFQAGTIPNSETSIQKTFPLIRKGNEVLGELTIHYSRSSIRQGALGQVKSTFLPLVLQVLFITLAVILIYHFMLTRHLQDLSEYTRGLTTDNLQNRFTLKRKKLIKSKDELDLLLAAIDVMRCNLQQQLEERAEMEKVIARNKKMEALGTLAGGVAHDLNNILTGIITYPELLMTDLPQESPMRKSLEKIKGSGQRASAIVNDLLTLARRAVPSTQAVDLNTVILNYLESPELIQLRQEHCDVGIKIQLNAQEAYIMGAEVPLSKCLMNLVTNAVEAIEGHGTVVISTNNLSRLPPSIMQQKTQQHDKFLVLTITDTGIGISSKDLERIFEPFYTKKVMGRSGSGLGMTVVYGTVQDYEGEISIDSTPGKGTSISIYFPVGEQAIKPVESLPCQCLTGHQEKILVVDDVEEQRQIAEQVLKKLGYRTDSVSSGEEALQFLQKKRVDLVLLDMIMEPGMDGLETLRKIKALIPEQKIILVSGYSATENIEQALAHGAGSYIKKPYLIETLGQGIQTALKGKHME